MVLICKTRISFTQRCFVSVWLKLAQWFWRRKFLQGVFFNIFLLFCYYLTLVKEREPSYEQTWTPVKDAMCDKFSWNYPLKMVREKKMKMWKVHWQTDGWTDGILPLIYDITFFLNSSLTLCNFLDYLSAFSSLFLLFTNSETVFLLPTYLLLGSLPSFATKRNEINQLPVEKLPLKHQI